MIQPTHADTDEDDAPATRTIRLPQDAYDALRRLAEAERRSLTQQAAILILDADAGAGR